MAGAPSPALSALVDAQLEGPARFIGGRSDRPVRSLAGGPEHRRLAPRLHPAPTGGRHDDAAVHQPPEVPLPVAGFGRVAAAPRSEEHTSELQSPCNLVCRLLL